MSVEIKTIQHGICLSDSHALNKLYELLGEQLLQFAEQITRSRELAEEVIQDVFMMVWEKRSSLAGIRHLKWYLYACVRNGSMLQLRKSRRREEVILAGGELPPHSGGGTPEDLMITAEAMEKINQAIEALPPRCHLIFSLVKMDGFKYREVAALLDLSLKTVENQLTIALKKIRMVVDW